MIEFLILSTALLIWGEINDGGNFTFTLATDSKQKWEGIVSLCREEKQIETLISTNIYVNEFLQKYEECMERCVNF